MATSDSVIPRKVARLAKKWDSRCRSSRLPSGVRRLRQIKDLDGGRLGHAAGVALIAQPAGERAGDRAPGPAGSSTSTRSRDSRAMSAGEPVRGRLDGALLPQTDRLLAHPELVGKIDAAPARLDPRRLEVGTEARRPDDLLSHLITLPWDMRLLPCRSSACDRLSLEPIPSLVKATRGPSALERPST